MKPWKPWKRLLGPPALGCWAAASVAAGDPISDWGRFERQVRDQVLPKDSLMAAFPAIWSALRGPDTGAAAPGADPPWVFPLAGQTLASVGKGGYRPDIRYGGSPIKGYDFFDGNRHGGHPAYDIFIRDRNRDSRDDRTGEPVPVVAPEDLTVLSTEGAWEPGSDLRGGKYVWAKARRSDRLLYFSHLDSVRVRPGEVLAAGTPLGWVGRTGKNAYAKRSPTHLHFMVLRVMDGRPLPIDPYPWLEKAVPYRAEAAGSVRAYLHYKAGRLQQPEGGKKEREGRRITVQPGDKCGYVLWHEFESAPGRYVTTPSGTVLHYMGDCSSIRDTLRAELRLLSAQFPARKPDSLLHLTALVRESTLTDLGSGKVYRSTPAFPEGMIVQGDIYMLSLCKEDWDCQALSDKLLADAVHFPDSLLAAARRDQPSYRRALRRLEEVLSGPLDPKARSRFLDRKRAIQAGSAHAREDALWYALGKSLVKLTRSPQPR